MHSASSILLLSNVVGDLYEDCYLLLWAGLLQRPSHLRQYSKKQFVDVFNKTSNIHKQHYPFQSPSYLPIYCPESAQMKVVIKVFTHTFIPPDTLKTSYWEFPCTSILNMCTLGVSLCSYLKHVYAGYFSAQLSETCVLWYFSVHLS